MISRRRVLASLTSTALLSATAVASTQCAPTLAPADEVDPALIAVQAHREAYETLLALGDTEPGYAAADDAEWSAWLRMTQTPPTTALGVATMASHLERMARREGLLMGSDFRTALLNLSTGAAALGVPPKEFRL